MLEFDDGWRPAEKRISEAGQAAYVESALKGIEIGWPGVLYNDILHLEVEHQVPEGTSKAMQFIAPLQARDLTRSFAYIPYELPRSWIDELE